MQAYTFDENQFVLSERHNKITTMTSSNMAVIISSVILMDALDHNNANIGSDSV